MADILTAVTTLVTSAVSWVTLYIGVLTDNPLLLMFVLISMVGLGVGLLRRLIRI